MHTNCASSHALSLHSMLKSFLRLETSPFAPSQGSQKILPRRTRSILGSRMSCASYAANSRPYLSVSQSTRSASSQPFQTCAISNIRSAGRCHNSRRAYHSTRLLNTEATKPRDRLSKPSTSKRKPQDPKEPEKPKKKPEGWQIQKRALENKFAEGWNPRKRLSPDALDGIRQLHAQDPVKFSTPVLASEFKVSPEAIRRILKSKWRPNEKQIVERKERWNRRNARIWNQMAELGLRAQRKSFAELSDVHSLYEGTRTSGSK